MFRMNTKRVISKRIAEIAKIRGIVHTDGSVNQSEIARRAKTRGKKLDQRTVGRALDPRSGEVESSTLEAIAYGLGVSVPELLSFDTTLSKDTPQAKQIPLIDYIKAGEWSDVTDPFDVGGGFTFYPVYMNNLSGSAFALKVVGDSMSPDYRPGDIVIVDPSVSPVPGDIVVAKLDNEDMATLKKYRLKGRDTAGEPIIELVPINPDWPTLLMDSDNPGHIVGRVVMVQKHV